MKARNCIRKQYCRPQPQQFQQPQRVIIPQPIHFTQQDIEMQIRFHEAELYRLKNQNRDTYNYSNNRMMVEQEMDYDWKE